MAGSDVSDIEGVVQQLASLWERGLDESARILGDLLLANSSSLGLQSHPVWHLSVLLTYSHSLFEDLQYRRALHYYKEALKTLARIGHLECKADRESLPTEGDIKWLMYKCHIQLKETQEALDMLSSVPLKQRDAKIAMALAKLYHRFKNDSRSALICYKQALGMCPFALEAMQGLFSLGMTRPEVDTIASKPSGKPKITSLTAIRWLPGWLDAQACIAKHDYTGAVSGFERLTKMDVPHLHLQTETVDRDVLGMRLISHYSLDTSLGFHLTPDTNCQLARCMVKLGRKATAEELFSTSKIQDPYVLKHMDTYARLLGSKKLETLATELLYVSPLHSEPWIAKAWQHTRDSALTSREKDKASVFVEKARSISPRNAEAFFIQASMSFTKQEIHNAIQKYSEAVHLDPTFFDAYEALIRCYLMVRSDKEAVCLARMAAKHFKLPAQQYYLEGIALSQKPNTIPKAKLALEKAIKADRTFEKAAVSLSGVLVHEGNVERAVDMLLKHLESYTSPILHTELGNCYMQLKHYQEAMDQYGLALCQDPHFDKALQGIENLQKLTSSELEDTASLGRDSELEDEGEDILVAGGLEGALEMDSDDSIPVMDLANQEYQW